MGNKACILAFFETPLKFKNYVLNLVSYAAFDDKFIKGHKMMYNVMRILDEQDGLDSENLVYAMTLINKTLYGIPDQECS